ncbi:MAG TPA: hypothetical protein VK469_18170, partial [Candidatus Kapabacteria bacterium]|nr:hypothetical protein [Candidatus Kapabacteria bacterium]
MEFVRTIVDSKRLEKIIYMPKKLKNQKVEVLILPILDKHKKKKEFVPEDFEGVLKIDIETLDREIEHLG